MARSVRDVMTPNPQGVETTASVTDAARIMKEQDVGPVPILEGGQLVGMLTDRDIAIRVVAEGRDPQSTTAGEIASRDLVTIDPQQNLDEALRLMAQHQVRRLPVVDEDGRLVGIVAQADVATEAPPDEAGQAVEQISQ